MQIFSNLNLRNNVPKSSPCLSLTNDQIQQHFKYNYHKDLCMSAQRATKCSAAGEATEAEVANKATPNIDEAGQLYKTKVISNKTLVGPKDELGEICHIILDHGGKFHFVEGQYLRVILHPVSLF